MSKAGNSVSGIQFPNPERIAAEKSCPDSSKLANGAAFNGAALVRKLSSIWHPLEYNWHGCWPGKVCDDGWIW